jgi:hypothetical protein
VPFGSVAPAIIEASTGDAAILADAVRETFTRFLSGPTLETVALRAPLESQARQEAWSAGCPYVLFKTARHVRNSGSGGLLGRAVGGAVQGGAWTAGAAAGSVAGTIAGGMVAGAAGAAAMEFAGSVRVKDELVLSYQLESATGGVLVRKKESPRPTGTRRSSSSRAKPCPELVRSLQDPVAFGHGDVETAPSPGNRADRARRGERQAGPPRAAHRG